MKNEIILSVENGVGIITLNREKAINALTPNMIEMISGALEQWQRASDVRMILLEGAGKKGFCAGGDVRWTREQIMDGNVEKVEEFFAAEYKMNLMIASCAKPIIALTHGVVMGGGIGLAGHARYRITTTKARFAMPEAAIGLFCDVGVRSILAKVKRQRALMFMFSANMVGAADAIELGLADAIISEDDFASVRDELIKAGGASEVDLAVKEIIVANALQAGVAEFCELADRFAEVFAGSDCTKIYDRLQQQVNKASDFAKVANVILARCPTSNFVHLAGLDAATKRPDIASVLQTDLALAKYLGARSDFLEGVRAVLVDKDQNPKWQPNLVAEVDGDAIFATIGENAGN